MTPPPRRFQFRLRTLLIVVTAFCLWCGYEMRIVRQRAEVLRWLADRGPVTYADSNDKHQSSINRWWVYIDDSRLSWYRRLLGDHFLNFITHPEDAPLGQVDAVKEVFPEAE